jgi:hypothetical protein
MGACDFFNSASGKTVAEAFRTVTADARYEHGHGGYTGTIAEKHDYKSASSTVFDSYDDAIAFANSKMDDDNHWCQDKWGPAAYVAYKSGNETKYLFFGWASS